MQIATCVHFSSEITKPKIWVIMIDQATKEINGYFMQCKCQCSERNATVYFSLYFSTILLHYVWSHKSLSFCFSISLYSTWSLSQSIRVSKSYLSAYLPSFLSPSVPLSLCPSVRLSLRTINFTQFLSLCLCYSVFVYDFAIFNGCPFSKCYCWIVSSLPLRFSRFIQNLFIRC